jgi:hypothetical protein
MTAAHAPWALVGSQAASNRRADKSALRASITIDPSGTAGSCHSAWPKQSFQPARQLVYALDGGLTQFVVDHTFVALGSRGHPNSSPLSPIQRRIPGYITSQNSLVEQVSV